MRRLLAVAAVVLLAVGAVAPAAYGADSPPDATQVPPGPVVACVYWEGSARGGHECVVHGQYPGSFVDEVTVRHCDYTDAAGTRHDDGDYIYKEGVIITSTTWVGGLFQALESFVDLVPAMLDAAAQDRPFAEVYRVFTKFCNSADENGRIGVVTVFIRDVFFNPAGKWREVLETSIDYRPWPILRTMPDPDASGFKALVVNTPTFLAIDPPAWHAEKSRDVGDRGWTMTYVATPIGLTFDVDGQRIDCVAGARARGDAATFPALPAGFTDTKFRDPVDGPDPRPCTWVPRRPGTYPVTISITYRRTFIAEGFVEPEPDRTFTFTENVNVVELKVVNVKPDGA